MTNTESRNLKLKTVKEGLIDSVKLKNLILEDQDVLDAIIDFGSILAKSVMSGNKVLIFGNGGSAADAQHLAAEMVGTYVDKKRAFPAIAITVDSSVITAISNDIGYDAIFARQIEALGVKGDIAIGITTSGNSKNIVNGLKIAKDKEMITSVLTGENISELSDVTYYLISVPSTSTPRIQEAHGTIIHILCDLIRSELK
ncbi:MAG: D-sedoheptulose 7-phosphate isomerase [Chloroflexi bacterium]|nr:MAG: D-sedoheptulose 7-phosphate isomerase [Chloroflexota bacterium]